MWRLIGVDIAAGALLVAAWYWIFRRFNRKRGLRVLQWIERAFEGHGDIAAVEWLSASHMQVRLRVVSDAHDPKADIATLKTFAIENGKPGVVEA